MKSPEILRLIPFCWRDGQTLGEVKAGLGRGLVEHCYAQTLLTLNSAGYGGVSHGMARQGRSAVWVSAQS